ncbi:MAG: LysM peptidoglycan-binding domain-containing protein [Ilumatobacteraceae bacterium]
MYDDIDNDRDFWQDEPTRRLPRLPQRVVSSRSDGATYRARTRQHLPVVSTPRRSRRPLDPFLVRLGLIGCVGVALLPLAYTLRHGASDVLRTAPTGGAAALPLADHPSSTVTAPVVVGGSALAPDPVETVSTEAPAVAAADADPVETTALDIDALPRAVPVNDVGTSSPATTAVPARQVSATAAPTAPPTTRPAATSPAKTEANATCSNTYEVSAGDYWIGIAGRANVKLKDLLAVNGATVQTPLYPGRDICLPRGASVPAAGTPTATTTARTSTNTTKPTVTTAAPTTTVTIPRRTYTADEVEAIIRAAWPDDLEDEAIRIARRESNLQPTAHNSCCYGLFQIYFNVHKGWLKALGITSPQQLMDPEIAAHAAYALYQRNGGWGPWAL